jgi:hypothetical protein
LAVVAVAPGAAAPPDGPSGDGSLDSLFEGRGEAGARAESAGRARSGAPEARTTTIDLSTAADPVPRRRGVVPLRHIVGARPPSGRWQARARRSVRIGGWVAAAATVSAGLVALWVLLFTTVSGGDVWLGRPLTPTKHDENATQQDPAPAGPGAGSLRPTGSTPPKPSATAATKAATPSHTSGKSGGGSATAPAGSIGSGGSGRNGADDPPGDDAGGTGTTAPTSGGGSGSGSGHGSGGSGSSSGGGSGGGSGGHGADD